MVHLCVDPGDKKGRHRIDSLQFSTGSPKLGQTGLIRLDHFGITLQREDQSDIHGDALRREAPYRLDAWPRGGDLHQKVGPIDPLDPLTGLDDRRLGIGGESGAHFDGDETIAAIAPLPHRAENVAGISDVGPHEARQYLGGVVTGLGQLPQRPVVVGAFGDCAGKDRRVGSDSADGVFGDSPLEFARVDHRTADLVGPDALTGRRQTVKAGIEHFGAPNDVSGPN